MSLSSTIPRNVYTGNGSTTTYAWTWMLNQASDLYVAVISNATPAVDYPCALGTDYTIQTPATQIGNASGGNIVFTSSGILSATAGQLPTGWKVVLRRTVVFQQNMSLRNQGEFQPASIESGLDALCMEIQELQDIQARCIQVPTDDAAPTNGIPLAVARENTFLAFDANGNPTVAASAITVPVSAIGSSVVQATNQNFLLAAIGIHLGEMICALNGGAYNFPLGVDYIVNPIALCFVPGSTNSGGETLNGSPILTKAGVAIGGGALVSGTMYFTVYDGTSWRIIA